MEVHYRVHNSSLLVHYRVHNSSLLVHYRVHNSSLLVPVLSLVSPVRNVSHSFCSKWFTRGVKRSVVMNDYTDRQISCLYINSLYILHFWCFCPSALLFKKPKHVALFGQLTFWHRSFTFNSNKSPTWCNNFSVYYSDIFLQLNMFRAFSRPSSARLSPRYEDKTRGCHCSHWAPDDERESARNMLSCKQTSG